MASKRWTIVHGGVIYMYAPPSEFVAAWNAESDPESDPPDDMIQMPEWVNRSKLTRPVLIGLIKAGLL